MVGGGVDQQTTVLSLSLCFPSYVMLASALRCPPQIRAPPRGCICGQSLVAGIVRS